MSDAISRFRKKFTLALLLFVAGTGLAFYAESGLVEYTAFASLLLGIFGAADLVDKDKFKK